MATVTYSLSTKTDATGKSEILIRFTHNGGVINQRAKTNIFIQPEYWNSDNQQIIIPKGRLMNKEQKELIQDLTNQDEKLPKIKKVIFSTFNDTDKKEIPKDWLKTLIDKINFPEKYALKEETPKTVTLFQFIEKFIEEAPNRKHKNTGRPLVYNNIQQYNTTKCHLKAFAKSINKKDFEFSEINQTFYDDFVSFLKLEGVTQDIDGRNREKIIYNKYSR